MKFPQDHNMPNVAQIPEGHVVTGFYAFVVCSGSKLTFVQSMLTTPKNPKDGILSLGVISEAELDVPHIDGNVYF